MNLNYIQAVNMKRVHGFQTIAEFLCTNRGRKKLIMSRKIQFSVAPIFRISDLQGVSEPLTAITFGGLYLVHTNENCPFKTLASLLIVISTCLLYFLLVFQANETIQTASIEICSSKSFKESSRLQTICKCKEVIDKHAPNYKTES